MTRPQVGSRFDVLCRQLTELGLADREIVLVHTSMRRLGRAAGSPRNLLRALQCVLGPLATGVVPTQTANNSTTSRDYFAAIRGLRPADVSAYQESLPGFSIDDTPSFRMGVFAEYVRRQPDAVRSPHPQTSFAAVGHYAEQLMKVHDLESHLGERSPLAAMYDAGASVLLLGVGYDKCTAMHLAEYRVPWTPEPKSYECFVNDNGQRVRQTFEGLDLDDTTFDHIGRLADQRSFARKARVGAGQARLLPMRQLVDFTLEWLVERRGTDGQ